MRPVSPLMCVSMEIKQKKKGRGQHSLFRLLSAPKVLPAMVGGLGNVASSTQTRSRGFGFHVAPEERRMHLLWRRGPQASGVRVTGAGGVCACLTESVIWVVCAAATTEDTEYRTAAETLPSA